MNLLAINCGSATLKFLLAAVGSADQQGPVEVLASGGIDGIGRPGMLRMDVAGRASLRRDVLVADTPAAVTLVLGTPANATFDLGRLAGIGHRIVHGGGFRGGCSGRRGGARGDELVDRLTPLHNGLAVAAMRTTRDIVGPDVPMVAVFDTAFHGRIPEHASRYALPFDLAEVRVVGAVLNAKRRAFVVARDEGALELSATVLREANGLQLHIATSTTGRVLRRGRDLKASP